jgi:hypothetical protein
VRGWLQETVLRYVGGAHGAVSRADGRFSKTTVYER